MRYLEKSFSVALGASKAYRDNWETTFGKTTEPSADLLWNDWHKHVLGCARCLPSGGHESACADGIKLREAWRAAHAANP